MKKSARLAARCNAAAAPTERARDGGGVTRRKRPRAVEHKIRILAPGRAERCRCGTRNAR